MKIALVTPPYVPLHRRIQEGILNFPVALGYIDAYLKEYGKIPNLETRIYDFYLQDSIWPAAHHLNDWRPDIVGISLSSLGLLNNGGVQDFVKKLKHENKDLVAVLGGLVPTFIDKEIATREPDIDYIVRGEGEETFTELVRCIYSGDDVSAVRGITYKENGDVHQNPPRAPPQDLDGLPFPTRELFDLKSKQKVDSSVSYGFPIPIIDSRGCEHNRCTFCGINRNFRRRSPDNIIEEIMPIKSGLERQGKKWRRHGIVFQSDNFNLDGATAELAEKIADNDLITSYLAQTRAEEVLKADERVLDALKRAYFKFSVGAESFNDSQLRRWRKFGSDVKNPAKLTEKALERLADRNMLHSYYMIWADPQTTKAELKQNLKGMLKWIGYVDHYNLDTMYLSVGSSDWHKFRKNNGVDVYSLCQEYGVSYPWEIRELEHLMGCFNGEVLDTISENFRKFRFMFIEPLLHHENKNSAVAKKLKVWRHTETKRLSKQIKTIYKWAFKLEPIQMMRATSTVENPFGEKFDTFVKKARGYNNHLVSVLKYVGVKDEEL